MKIFLLFITYLISGSSVLAQDQLEITERSDFSIGETIEFQSDILNEKRQLNIYLPSNYDKNSKKSYPVIYLLDGSADEDFIHIAGLVQFGSFSWINLIPETIVVGIANIDRKHDFTYSTRNQLDQKDFPSNGGSGKFISVIGKEIQPLIEKNYRTNTSKTVIGQSLGGLLATEILFKSPSLFDNYIIISPSLWWDDESLLKVTPVKYTSPKSVYIGVGKEGEVMERVARELFEKVDSKKVKNTSTYFGYFEQLTHGDTLHLAVYDAFNQVFNRKGD